MDNFHIYAPSVVFEGTTSVLLIKVLDRNGTPLDGMAGKISCYIQNPDGSMLLDGRAPIEQTPGIYLMYFTVGETIGACRCWATCQYNSTLTEMDAGIFSVQWDAYDNISRLYERVGSILFLEHWDNANMTQQMSTAFQGQNKVLNNISQQTLSTDFNTNLQQIAVEQGIGTLFWTIILVAAGIFGAVFYSHRKGKRERRELFAAAPSVPQALVSEIVQYGRKRGK